MGVSAGEIKAARAAWPTVSIPARAFSDWLAAHGGSHLSDLYLACACLQGNAAAIEQLEGAFLSQVGGFLAGIDPRPEFADEVRQALREHLLVGRVALADYSGKGPLRQWLRVTAQRIALNLRRGRKPHSGLLDYQRA